MQHRKDSLEILIPNKILADTTSVFFFCTRAHTHICMHTQTKKMRADTLRNIFKQTKGHFGVIQW